MPHHLFAVTGAPGAGKSTTLESFIDLNSSYLALDIDWLAESASNLANRNIYTDSSTWKAYGDLWFDVLRSIHRNGTIPVFFTPNSPKDFEIFGIPSWCSGVSWLLLDCDESTRIRRLESRPNWTGQMIEEALNDSIELKQTILDTISTTNITPIQVAGKVLSWVKMKNDEC